MDSHTGNETHFLAARLAAVLHLTDNRSRHAELNENCPPSCSMKRLLLLVLFLACPLPSICQAIPSPEDGIWTESTGRMKTVVSA